MAPGETKPSEKLIQVISPAFGRGLQAKRVVSSI